MQKPPKIIDLTHSISPETPTWDGACGFHISNKIDYDDCTPPDLFRVQKIESIAGIGTHIDAPAHCSPGGTTIDKLEIENLVTECIVINLENNVDENSIIMPEVVNNFEEEHGTIPEDSFVIFHTGWSKYWTDKEKYNNDHTFPGIHVDTAKLLLKRKVAGLGTDTLSADTGKDGYPVHQAFLGAGKYLVENIANARELPPIGAKVFVLPMKIENGTEAPIRLIALI